MNRELLPQPSLYQFVLAKSDGLLARMLRSINERVDQCGGLPAKSDALRIMAVKEAAFSETLATKTRTITSNIYSASARS